MTVRIIQGDAHKVLGELESESVQCVVTSPPYWGLRNYGVDGQVGLEPIPDCLGWATGEPCGECFVCGMVDVFRDVRRVLRPDGVVWLNLGDSYIGSRCGGQGPAGALANRSISKERANVTPEKSGPGLKPKDLVGVPWRVALALQADGWWLRSDVIWDKPTPMPEAVYDRPARSHEYLFLLSKRRRPYFYDWAAVLEPASPNSHPRGAGVHPKARNADENVRGNPSYSRAITQVMATRKLRDVWRVYSEPYKEAHFATFPPGLVEPCIKAGSSERGACATCGTPWERQTEKRQVGNAGRRPVAGAVKDNWSQPNGGYLLEVTTVGWRPGCGHGDVVEVTTDGCSWHVGSTRAGSLIAGADPQTVPCTILDLFAGAGTTGLVADRLGRDAVLIELNPDYCDMARRRIEGDAPLFAEVT